MPAGELLASTILPSAPTGSTARLVLDCPPVKLTMVALAAGEPSAQLDRYPALVGVTALTATTTAETPLEGTPLRPVICTAIDLPAPTSALGAPLPVRLSNTRAGATGTYAPAAVGVPAR